MSADDGILFIRAEEVEIPDDSEHTSLTPAGVTRVEEDLPAAEDVGPGDDLKETRGATVETAPDPLVELKDGEKDDTKGEEAAAGTVEIAPDTVTQPIGPADEETEPPDRRVWAIGGMAVAGILGLVFVINMLTGPDETTQTTAVVTTVTVADTTLPAEASPFVPWTRVAEQDSLGGEGDQEMYDVTGSDDGWVAVGAETRDGTTRPAAWTSEDGTQWNRVSDDAIPSPGAGFSRMLAVAPWESGVLAVGTAPENESGIGQDAAVWRSDDGTTWTRVSAGSESLGGPYEQRVRNLTVWPSGLVAVGFEVVDSDQNGAIWTSSNGVDWERVADPDGVFGGEGTQRIHAVVPGGPGLVAIGESGPRDDLDLAIWVSANGVDWERVEDSGGVLGGPGHQVAYSASSNADGMLIAGGFEGFEGDYDGAVWTSSDGVTWSHVGRIAFEIPDDQVIHSVAQVGGGWVAAGWTFDGGDQNGAIWASEKGLTWVPVDAQAAGLAGPGNERIESVAASGVELMAVGIELSDTAEGAVWIGQPD
jgi:hypothetical protein